MHILSGLMPQDSGTIRYRGEVVTFHSPHDALKKGIGMVHQQPGIVPGFSILDNVIIGQRREMFSENRQKKSNQ